MKIKVWTDSNNRLLNWAYADEYRAAGPTDEGFEVIEVADATGLYENHASIIDGKVVPDSGYVPSITPPNIDTTSSTQQIADLQKSNDELQSALLELSDIVLSGGGTSK